MKFTRQTRLKSFLEITGPSISRVLNGPALAALEAYCAFLRGKGGQGGERAHHWEIAAALQSIRSEAPVVFDVGAAVGEWTQSMLEEKPGAQVYMLEPQPASQERIKSLGMKNATLVGCALGDVDGEATLYAPKKAAVVASLHKREDSRWTGMHFDEIQVPVRTLTSIAKEHGLDFIDFVKMDIEGHELAALKGAQDLMRKKKIGALSFEFGPGNVNSRTMFIDFYELLSDNGFDVFRILPGGRLQPLPSYDEDCEFYRGTCNYSARLKA